jgi:hypothetical protein
MRGGEVTVEGKNWQGAATSVDQRLRGRGCSWCAMKGERRRGKQGAAASSCARFKRHGGEQRKGGPGVSICVGPGEERRGGPGAAVDGSGDQQWPSTGGRGRRR